MGNFGTYISVIGFTVNFSVCLLSQLEKTAEGELISILSVITPLLLAIQNGTSERDHKISDFRSTPLEHLI